MDDTLPPKHTPYSLGEVDVADDDSMLNVTQRLRMTMIRSHTSNGMMPTDPETQTLLLKAAADMDKVALGKKRIKADEKIADTQAQASAVLADVLRQRRTLQAEATQEGIIPKPEPKLGVEFARPHILEGQMDIAPGAQTVETFMRDHKREAVPIASPVL